MKGHRNKITAALMAVGCFAAAALTLMLATPANADPAACKTVASTLTGRPDNSANMAGQASEQWALNDMTRTVVVCETAPGTYHATLTDDGTFTASHDPGSGDALPEPVTGSVKGGFTEDFTAAPAFADFDPSAYDGKGFAGTDGGSTSDWVKAVYGGQTFAGQMNQDWAWTYATGCEQWVDSAANNDGQDADAGAITGKTCDTGSPTPTKSSSHPAPSTSHSTPAPATTASTRHAAVVAATSAPPRQADAAGAQLASTGASPIPYVIAAFLALAGGISMTYMGRRRSYPGRHN